MVYNKVNLQAHFQISADSYIYIYIGKFSNKKLSHNKLREKII